MKYLLTGFLFGIIVGHGMVFAQEPSVAQCQTLANQFSKNPDSLAIQALERLRFCVNQALEQRERNLKGELLKGTIIESPSPSDGALNEKPPMAPKNLKMQ